jgi:uncharacterized protein (TIGR00251 family)
MGQKGLTLAIRVIPRSKRNEIVGIMDDGRLKVRLIAPPVDGKANRNLIQFLAKILITSVSNLEIIAGMNGRDKIVSIIGLDIRLAEERIQDSINLTHSDRNP